MSLARSLKDGLQFHAQVIKSGFTPTVFTSNQLIHLYSKNGLIREAYRLFDEMPERNVYSWNTVINAYIKAQNLSNAQNLFDAVPEKDSVTYNSLISGYANRDGFEDRAVRLFLQMQNDCDGVRRDEFTLTTMLNLTAKLSALSWGQQLHSFMLKTANDLSGFAVSSLIDMYSKSGSFPDAWTVFERGSSSAVDLVSKNAMVAACCREGKLDLAQNLFWSKHQMNDSVSWNTMIAGFAQNGQEEKAIEMFKCMAVEGFSWNEHSFASVLSAFSSLKALKMGKEIHSWVVKKGIDSNPFISSGIVDLYSKCGNMNYAEFVYLKMKVENSFAVTSMIVGYAAEGNMAEARRLFDSLADKNSVVWTAMISGYVKTQQSDDAFELFRQFMERDARDYDALLFINLLGACTTQAIVDPGKQIHAYIMKVGIEIDEKVVTAVVDMYCKCGSIGYAERIFQNLASRDLILHNVMIAGYAHHGYEYEALQLFEEMVKRGLQPDAVTFVAILSACRHSGLVEVGENYFSSMTEDYSILPERDHYACMIDLYGRANQLEKATVFMDKIPMELDAIILGTFINACKMNRNVKLANDAEEKLLKIEGDNGARYVQLAGVYASEGRWDEMGRIMKKMRGKELRKHTGCSWLQVGNRRHTFISNDRSHSETEAVHAMLDCLIQELVASIHDEEELSQ
ncbi:putative pentatricopeptide repeat-containing protein At3g18840 [Coffea arabica]|uniref:Pentatricopeptide repeat-containing protein At3g18840 n=1 Tax=Coffea arabica TaxID=13443 RepID=A0A6P6VRW4_COFAR|nr:putative pentatricopeptide repeat-containing protein At3g18840 [Coffea arabica]XP_027112306.1 putative pentatricopeptide repeat-containing protein At3g18840 [Coffea arabica]